MIHVRPPRPEGPSTHGRRLQPTVRAALLVLLVGFARLSWAANASSGTDVGGIYTGTIGGKAILMHLTVSENELRGAYFYQSVGSPLALSGRLGASCAVELTEFVAANGGPGKTPPSTGHFEGGCKPDGSLSGRWSSPDGKRSLPFSLERIGLIRSLSAQGAGKAAEAKFVAHYPEFSPKAGVLATFVGQQLAEEAQAGAEEFRQALAGADSETDVEVEVDYAVAYFSQELVSIRVLTTNSQSGGREQASYESRLFARVAGKPRRATVEDVLATPIPTSAERVASLAKPFLPTPEGREAPPHVLPVVNGHKPLFTVTARGLEIYFIVPPEQRPRPLIIPFKRLKGVVLPTGVLQPLLQ